MHPKTLRNQHPEEHRGEHTGEHTGKGASSTWSTAPGTPSKIWTLGSLLSSLLSFPLLLALVMIPTASFAAAPNSVSLAFDGAAPSGPLVPGSTLALRVHAHFSEPTWGGGVQLVFDPSAFSFSPSSVNFVLPGDNLFEDNPNFRCPTASLAHSVSCGGDPNFLSFGSFTPGLTGDFDVLSLTLDVLSGVIGAGSGGIDLSLVHPFAGAHGEMLNVGLSGVSVTVPEPASLLLLGIGIAGLTTWRRMKHEEYEDNVTS